MSESLVGKTPVSGALCQREAELVLAASWEKPPGSKPGSNLRLRTASCWCDAESTSNMEIPAELESANLEK
jgi:hypothetical protein